MTCKLSKMSILKVLMQGLLREWWRRDLDDGDSAPGIEPNTIPSITIAGLRK
jgi:hypothetical protein